MQSQEFNDKVQLFRAAACFQKTKKVPNLSNDYTWKICDSKYGYKEAYFNEKIMEKIVCEFHERYDFDAYIDLGTRNHFPQMAALGSGSYVLNEKTGAINVTDFPTLAPEEYDEFAKDPMSWFNIFFERKFPNISTKDFVNATMSFLKSSGYAQKIGNKFAQKYNRPMMVTTSASVQAPFEIFHSSLRGISGIATDMRRFKEPLKHAMESYWEAMVKPGLDRALSAPEDKNYIADVYCGIIGHEVMNIKQFDELYWPYLEKILTATSDKGKLVYIFVEDSIMRFANNFTEVKKGSAIMHLELDNLTEMRKLIPNMPLAGGMTTDLLGYSTPEACVEKARTLINELGEGFLMSQNKMLSFKNDCKRENLLAVNNFIKEYTI